MAEPTSQPDPQGSQGQRCHGCWGPVLDRGKRALVSPCLVQMRATPEGLQEGWHSLAMAGALGEA